MNTPSHAILNLFFLGRQNLPQANLPIFIGAILPDIPIFVFYGWAKFIARLPERQIWSEAYYEPFWQTVVALSHSIPLALLGWLIAYKFKWKIVQLFCISLVLHSLLDLPVHHDDAHRHFFPFSDYRFISPFSYWDPNHHGTIVSMLEISLVLVASVPVFTLIQSWFGKGLLIFINLAYFYFFLRLNG